MTEQEKAAKRAALAAKKPPRSRRSVIAATAALAASLSIAVFGGLSLQMAKGNDPVLAQKSGPVVKKRIVVIKKMIQPRETVVASAPSYSSGYSSSPSYSAPSSSYSAPAPAPAPAPVVSSPS